MNLMQGKVGQPPLGGQQGSQVLQERQIQQGKWGGGVGAVGFGRENLDEG